MNKILLLIHIFKYPLINFINVIFIPNLEYLIQLITMLIKQEVKIKFKNPILKNSF